MPIALGVALVDPDCAHSTALAREAEALGCESLWVGTGSGDDAFAALAAVVSATSRARVGSWAYALAARPPLVSAREIAVLDQSSGGRLELGLAEVEGAALAEAITLCKKLWSDPSVEHRGASFALDETSLEPRPRQKPWPPLHLAASSERALDRVARMADGWIALGHTPTSIDAPLAYLRERRARAETLDGRFSVSARAEPRDRAELEAWRDAGVDRLIVSLDALRRLRA